MRLFLVPASVANMTEVNETHVNVRLWLSTSSSTTLSPQLTTITTAKRPWSPQSPYTWPATLYDAFHALYADDLRATTMTWENAATFNASRLFSAMYGRAVMEQCARNLTGQLLLVQHNTETGPVTEAVTRNDIAHDTIQHVYQRSGQVEVAETRRSSWWPDCILLFWRGDTA